MSLTEGKDFYIENGRYVFTSHYLIKRGYCCSCNCRHCPYDKEKLESAIENTVEIEKEQKNPTSNKDLSYTKEKN